MAIPGLKQVHFFFSQSYITAETEPLHEALWNPDTVLAYEWLGELKISIWGQRGFNVVACLREQK